MTTVYLARDDGTNASQGKIPDMAKARGQKKIHLISGMLPPLNAALKQCVTKQDVAGIMGIPDNDKTEPVWMWVSEMPQSLTNAPWKRLIRHPGFFVIFVEDDLASGLVKNAGGDPELLLQIRRKQQGGKNHVNQHRE